MAAAQRGVAIRAALVAALLVGASAAARAQLAASVTGYSDYRFRGVSLGDDRPGVQLAVNYDTSAGWFLGASGTGVALGRGRRYAAAMGYAGYAAVTTQGLSWELGAVASHFSGDSSYDYAEAFTGLSGERWNVRLYLAPDYFGRGVATAYLEGNGNLPLGEYARLLGHAGVLAGRGGADGSDSRRARIDGRLGGGYARDAIDLQLAWVAATRGGPYPAVYDSRRGAWVLSVTLAF